jgi:hypothetical protein
VRCNEMSASGGARTNVETALNGTGAGPAECWPRSLLAELESRYVAHRRGRLLGLRLSSLTCPACSRRRGFFICRSSRAIGGKSANLCFRSRPTLVASITVVNVRDNISHSGECHEHAKIGAFGSSPPRSQLERREASAHHVVAIFPLAQRVGGSQRHVLAGHRDFSLLRGIRGSQAVLDALIGLLPKNGSNTCGKSRIVLAVTFGRAG